MDKNNLNISLEGKFTTERGRINCSLREKNGFYRWLGYSICSKRKIILKLYIFFNNRIS